MTTSLANMQQNPPAKRKRAQISYAEPDDELFGESSGEDIHREDHDDDKLPEDDTEYGSRTNINKRKIGPRKRIRVIAPKPFELPKPFRFLDLPPELRDYIYELALTEPRGLTVISKYNSFRRTVCRGLVYNQDFYSHRYREENIISKRYQWNHLLPQLLAVSKQIHSEAVGYLYKQPIILEDTLALHSFLAAIGPSNRLLLSDVVVKSWGHSRGTHRTMNVAALTSLAACTNLQKLRLDCRIGHQRTPKQLARQIFRDGHYFLEGFGAANGRKDAAIDVLELNDRNFGGRRSGLDWVPRSVDSRPDTETFKGEFQKELEKLILR